MIRKDGTRVKTVLKTLFVDEISAVDFPAQKPARAALMKRDTDLAKGIWDPQNPILLTESEGHTHIVDLQDNGGETTYSKIEGSEGGHSHPWVRNPDGSITVGASAGHTHEVVMPSFSKGTSESEEQAPASSEENGFAGNVQKSQEDSTMNEDEKKQLEELQKKLAKAEGILSLPSDQRAHYDGLAEDKQADFLAKSAEERKTIVESELAKKAAEKAAGEETVYTSDDGRKFTKRHDPEIVELAKALDSERRERRKTEDLRKADELAKRANELKHLPGDESTKVALLKALEGIEGEQKDKALALLKAHDAGLAEAFTKRGTTEGGSDEGSAEARYEALVKKVAAENPTLSKADAERRAFDSAEGQKLYGEMKG